MFGHTKQKIEKVFITQVSQLHKPARLDELSETLRDAILYSQFIVAKFLLTHSKDIVVLEGLDVDYNSNKREEFSAIIDKIWHVFPNGFPNYISELNEPQKDYLLKYGGPKILFFLNMIDSIHKSCDLIKLQCYEERVRKKWKEYPRIIYIPEIYEPRERQAIHWGRKKALENNNPNIIIIFGVMHDFKKRIELIGDNSIAFKELIDTSPHSYKENYNTETQELIKKLHYNIPMLTSSNEIKPVFDKYYQAAEQAETIEQLLEAGKNHEIIKFSELLEYAIRNNINLSKVAINNEEQVNILQWCICYCGLAFLSACLKLTGNVFLNALSSTGSTSLHYAVRKNRKIFVNRLIEAGADKNIRDYEGKTALDIAKQKKSIDIVNLFTDQSSADVLIKQNIFSIKEPVNKASELNQNFVMQPFCQHLG